MYKIYNPVTNNYAKGGIDDLWTKHGKIWPTINNLKLHLSVVKSYPYTNRYQKYITHGCMVINVLTDEEFPIKLLIDNPENF